MKKLFFAVVVLALFAAVVKQQQPESTSQILPSLPQFDVADVASMIIRQGEQVLIEVSKVGNDWMLVVAETPAPIKADAMEQLLADLNTMQPKRVASTKAEHHGRFSVTDAETSVELRDVDGSKLLHLWVGKSATDLRSTYIRVAGDDTVVTVDKTLTWQVKRTQEAWLAEEVSAE